MSPYVFVMAIEVISSPLNKVAITGDIAYHPFHSKLQLTHLGFADDILIFLKDEQRSLNSVLNIFDNFYKMSSLKLNPNKIVIYSVGIDDDTTSKMLRRSAFKKGKLPVRYLPRRLTNRDYKPLIEKITSRI